MADICVCGAHDARGIHSITCPVMTELQRQAGRPGRLVGGPNDGDVVVVGSLGGILHNVSGKDAHGRHGVHVYVNEPLTDEYHYDGFEPYDA